MVLRKLVVLCLSQVDQNGIVYDRKTDRKCLENGKFTALYSVYTAHFVSV
jgi:hypothetical protein